MQQNIPNLIYGIMGLLSLFPLGGVAGLSMEQLVAGIGIQKSIRRRTASQHSGYEWLAIKLPTIELVPGASSSTRVIGLFSVLDEMRQLGMELKIHSENGLLTKSEESQQNILGTTCFPGQSRLQAWNLISLTLAPCQACAPLYNICSMPITGGKQNPTDIPVGLL